MFQGASAGRLPAGRCGCRPLGHGGEIGGQYWALNNDPIPPVSPNDVLCPLMTYLFVGFYAAFRHPTDAIRFEQARVVLTLVSFIVNVVTI
jgi:hypothetical protein